MSKQFRTATQTRRGARGGYPEHDDFEGLPVRQWRQERVNVAPVAPPDTTQQNDRWALELPYGMPKEYTLLQPHTQELLRAARSGRLYKRPAPVEDDDADADAADAKGEKKELDPAAGGYTVKVWKQSSRNQEDITHLAKRHRNTVVLASRAPAPQIVGPTARRVTVRKTDAAGNTYQQMVIVAEGQTVDGDILSDNVIPAPAASGLDMAAQQSTTPRKKPVPPKRKAKGPGRGRKKGKLPISVPLPRPEATGESGAASGDVKPGAVGPDGIKIEEVDSSKNQDAEMADVSVIPSDEEDGDDGDEGDEDGDEGGDDESGQTPEVGSNAQDQDQDQEMGDSESSEVIRPTSIEEPEDTPRVPLSEEEDITIAKPRFTPPAALGSLGPLQPPARLASPRVEGSPLKNVIIQSPTDASPMISPRMPSATGSFATSGYMETSMSMDVSGSEAVASETFVTEMTTSATGTVTEEFTSTTMDFAGPSVPDSRSGEVGDLGRIEELPTMIEGPEAANEEESPAQKVETPVPTLEISEPQPEPQAVAPTPPKMEPVESQPTVLEPPKSPNLLPTVTADEADINLLGPLEMELDRQEKLSSAANSVTGPKTPTPPLPAAADPSGAPAEPFEAADATEPPL
ncbi:hypothetical protein QBC34DRAFT_397364 [Podospora aff. communis PSN243]|uniref:Lyr family protein n=1 Tax=Podospora aff. communis PSN243 TaxID=3040156 RepID=A0AAV9GYR3_9PEZI|nr:hypothetical protein QBC34DRAFT_397364 [Podospora aff. communis PSN243]